LKLHHGKTDSLMTESDQHRFASGLRPHDSQWSSRDLPTLAGAGALRSTASDLLTFLRVVLDYV
jgi:hypothetical protein